MQCDKIRHRQIDVWNDARIYCISMNERRRQHITDTFGKYCDVTFVDGVKCDDRFTGAARAWGKAIDIALRDRKNSFEPFVIMEDDCSPMDDFSRKICTHDDADAVYIGISGASVSPDCWNNVFDTIADETTSGCDTVRTFGMLSMHCVLFLTPAFAAAVRACMVETAMINRISAETLACDVPVARTHTTYNVQALKLPLVFQDENFDGNQRDTKICINDFLQIDEATKSVFNRSLPESVKFCRR